MSTTDLTKLAVLAGKVEGYAECVNIVLKLLRATNDIGQVVLLGELITDLCKRQSDVITKAKKEQPA
jgi:hypothetical protein